MLRLSVNKMGGCKDKKHRRIIAAAIVIALLAAAAVAVHLTTGTFRSAKPSKYGLDEELSMAFSNADEVVDAVRAGLVSHASSIHISCRAGGQYMDDISPLVDGIMEAAQQETESPVEGDYIRYQLGGYTNKYSCTKFLWWYKYEITIIPEYYTYAYQEEWVDEKVAEIMESFGFSPYTSDAEKVAAVYEYVMNTVQYDEVHLHNKKYHKKATAYAALKNGRAVCQGYSVLMYRLLREAGVGCRVITGDAIASDGTSEYHSWNIVCIDGLWYNLDATWDSLLCCGDYYLKCDESIQDHVRSEEFACEEFYRAYPMAQQDYMQ